jgi:ubiquinone/menaquinone biosynthesis C-methylase UbiE
VTEIVMTERVYYVDERAAVIQSERDFHNLRFGAERDPREHLSRWYSAVRHGAEWQDDLVVRKAAGKDVLEYGCSDGSQALDNLRLPEICSSLKGIDISDKAIEKARDRAKRLGYQNAEFHVMNAEAMSFPDGMFDVVFGRGILHHLELERSFREISRVLKGGGLAIFSEPLGHNPLINMYRNRTPGMRTPDEHPLLIEDFKHAKKYFSRVVMKPYGLFAAASAIVDRDANGLAYRLGKALDHAILRGPIGRFAWHSVVVLHKM